MGELQTLGLGFDPYKLLEEHLDKGKDTIYFVNILKTRLDENVARGAKVKALAVGSKNKTVLEPLTKFIEASLDSIFNVQRLDASLDVNLKKSQLIIEDMYD